MGLETGCRPWHVRSVGNPISDVINFASANGGVVTTSEALALGMSSSTLQRRVVEGVLIRHRPGLLVLPGVEDEHLLDLHAASRKLGAVASHQSAAYVHDLDRPNHVKPTVSVHRNHTKSIAGVTVHQLDDLEPSHVTEVDNLRVTTAERTIVDLAAVLSAGHLARIMDNGLAANRIDLDLIQTVFAEIGRRGKPGTTLMRGLLQTRGNGYIAPESELERRLLYIIDRADLPEPVRQFRAPWLRPVNGRVDLAYPDQLLLIEGDSRRWHTLSASFETDRLRDNAAQLAGWRILRFTWDEITKNPERVTSSIRKGLELEPI